MLKKIWKYRQNKNNFDSVFFYETCQQERLSPKFSFTYVYTRAYARIHIYINFCYFVFFLIYGEEGIGHLYTNWIDLEIYTAWWLLILVFQDLLGRLWIVWNWHSLLSDGLYVHIIYIYIYIYIKAIFWQLMRSYVCESRQNYMRVLYIIKVNFTDTGVTDIVLWYFMSVFLRILLLQWPLKWYECQCQF